MHCPYVKGAITRAFHPYRPKTMSSYKRQFHTFLCYSIKNNVQTVLSMHNLLGFLEFLVACNMSPRGVSNYASAIKSYVCLYQLPAEWLGNTLISNYLRALHIQVPTTKRPKSVLSLHDVYNVSVMLEKLDHPLVFRSAILLAFYGFLRISNLVSSK